MTCPSRPWIPERSATGLREADLNVLSELGNQGLEWRLEPEAFSHWIDARSLMVSREALARRGATAFVATRQITPQGLRLLCGSIDEGVDCLAADGPQQRFVPGFQPGDLFGHPSLGEPVPHEQTYKAASRSRIASLIDRLPAA